MKFKDNPNGKLLRGLSIGNDLDTTGRTSVLLYGQLYPASTLQDASSNDTEGFPRAQAASNQDGPTFQKAGEQWRNLFKTLGRAPVHFIHLLFSLGFVSSSPPIPQSRPLAPPLPHGAQLNLGRSTPGRGRGQ